MKPLLTLLAAALVLAACGPPAALVPTATPAPTATATPRPTATPTPAPTATAAPTAAAGDDAIGAALRQTARADSYTISLTVAGKGAVMGGPGGAGQADLASLSGAFDGDDYEYALTGAAATLLTGAPDVALRVVRSGGVSYLRGPVPLLGAAEDAWYRLSPEQATLAVPPVSAASTAGALAGTSPDFSAFTPAAEELRAGQGCRRYTGGREGALALLQSLAQSGLPVDGDPARVQAAEAAVVVCEDGYLHDLDLSFAGTSAGERPAPYSYDLRLRLADFGAGDPIVAPEGAREIPAPTR